MAPYWGQANGIAKGKGILVLKHISVFSIIPGTDVGVRGDDHDCLPVVDGDGLRTRFLLRRAERLTLECLEQIPGLDVRA